MIQFIDYLHYSSSIAIIWTVITALFWFVPCYATCTVNYSYCCVALLFVLMNVLVVISLFCVISSVFLSFTTCYVYFCILRITCFYLFYPDLYFAGSLFITCTFAVRWLYLDYFCVALFARRYYYYYTCHTLYILYTLPCLPSYYYTTLFFLLLPYGPLRYYYYHCVVPWLPCCCYSLCRGVLFTLRDFVIYVLPLLLCCRTLLR